MFSFVYRAGTRGAVVVGALARQLVALPSPLPALGVPPLPPPVATRTAAF